MWTSPKLLAAVLCVALIGAAHAFAATTPSTKNLPAGLSFTYDTQHDQINANGVQMNAAPLASPTIPPTTGTITVTINIKVVSHFRAGTEYHCSLTVIGGAIDTTSIIFGGGIETANGVATPDGTGVVVCTLTIPYSWTIPPDPAAVNGLILAFGASAISGHDSQKQVARSTLQVDGVEPLPANGGSQSFVFDAAL
jgi:hypothetical protein